MQVTRSANFMAWPTSCSTSSTVVPAADDGRHGLVDLLHDHGRQTQRHLVEQEEPRIGHQAPADGQSLLLAPRRG